MFFIRLSVIYLTLTALGSMADQGSFVSENNQFAGEIILLTPPTSPHPTAASENRKKAISSLTETPPPSSIIILPEGESGVLLPPGVGTPADNRNKARNYLNEPVTTDQPSFVVRQPEHVTSSPNLESPRINVRNNLDRARRYAGTTGGKPGTSVKFGTSTGVVGADGVVVVACDDSNIAGRIGDDTQSGNVFAIVVKGKLVKARCE